MRKLLINQSGFAPLIVVLILVLGVVAGVFFVQKTQIFSPKAQQYIESKDTVNTVTSSNTTNYNEKLLMVNYKFTNPGETKVQATVRVAVADLKAKIGLIGAYYGITPNLHFTGKLMSYAPARSPYDPQWDWTVDPYAVTASEVLDPSCYKSPNDVSAVLKSLSDESITLEMKSYEERMKELNDKMKICFQSSNIESIEGISAIKTPDDVCKRSTNACLNSDPRVCLTFSCHLPEGWTESKDIPECQKVGGCDPGDKPGDLPDAGAQLRDEQRIKDLKAIHDALLIYKKDHNSFCLKGNGNCKGNTDAFVQYLGKPAVGLEKYPQFSVEKQLSRYLYPIPHDPLTGYSQSETSRYDPNPSSPPTVKLGDKVVPWPDYMVVMYDDNSFVLSARLEVMKPENKNCVPQDAPLVNYCINQE